MTETGLADHVAREPIFYLTLCIAVLVLPPYLLMCARKQKAFDLGKFILAFLSCGGVGGGGLMMAATVVPKLQSLISDSHTYMFIAGIAVTAVSIRELLNFYRPS